MAHSQQPQLMMRVDLSRPLPALSLPDGFSIHTEQPGSDRVWAWIIGDSFGDPKFSYDKMRGEPCYRPDRVYFVREYHQDIATAAAYERDQYPGEGYVHMVGTHSTAVGRSAGYFAVLAVLHRFQQDGLLSAVLTTDDFRLPAIHTYLKLGFEPVDNHESSAERWQNVRKELMKHQPVTREPIALWPGEAPYSQHSPGQAQPSIKPFAVEGSKGAVVVCPGGGYHMKASHEGDPIAVMLNQAGISAYVLDYRVKPCHWEAPLSDAKRAIRVLRQMGYEKVGILGFSAGGHLTCSAATLYDLGDPDSPDEVERHSSRPDAFVPCYAVVSMASFRHQGSLKALLGEQSEDVAFLRRFSADLNVNGDTPPAFLWHTAADAAVPVEHSLSLAAALSRAMVPFEMHIFPDGAHGLGLAGGVRAVEQWPALCQDWLIRQGFGK